MSLLVTGGLGFLGLQVARHYLRRGTVWAPHYGRTVPLQRITLFDVPEALNVDDTAGGLPPDIAADNRIRVMTGDITEQGVAEEIVDDESISVIHLASMVSGDTEQDHLRGWSVNVEGQRSLLEALRTKAPGSRFVFTSTTATLGPVEPGAPDASDATKLLPQNTYGFHKAVCELMINDYSRRGFVDGRCLRLPVVVVRPGRPNAALTGAWSSVVREPLNGMDSIIPVPMDTRLPCASYQVAVQAMSTLLEDVDAGELGADRALMCPSLSLSPAELHDAARAIAERDGLACGTARSRAQEVATRIVSSMGERSDGARAMALGIPRDESVERIVQMYVDDNVVTETTAAPKEPAVGA